MSPIRTLLIHHKPGIDFRVINEIKQKEACIDFVAITSEPKFILDMLSPNNGVEVAVLDKSFICSYDSPLHLHIDKTCDHIPLVLIDEDLKEYIPPQDPQLPPGVFMAIPRFKCDSAAECLEMDNHLRQSIIYTGNLYRRLRGVENCCGSHVDKTFRLYSSAYFFSQPPSYIQEDKETGRNFFKDNAKSNLPPQPTSVKQKFLQSQRWRAGSLAELLTGAEPWPPLPRIRHPNLLAIGISTGGPETLKILLKDLPADFPAPILLVQHISANFISCFLDTVKHYSRMNVEFAQNGIRCKPGTLYIAPDKVHLGVEPFGTNSNITLMLDESSPRLNGHVPSVGFLFESIARSNLAASTVAVIMTGMGEDGAAEIGRIKDGGGIALAQDELSCNVFGMPKVAIQLGNVHREVPLRLLADLLKYLFHAI